LEPCWQLLTPELTSNGWTKAVDAWNLAIVALPLSLFGPVMEFFMPGSLQFLKKKASTASQKARPCLRNPS
jgi:hypothetical protein